MFFASGTHLGTTLSTLLGDETANGPTTTLPVAMHGCGTGKTFSANSIH